MYTDSMTTEILCLVMIHPKNKLKYNLISILKNDLLTSCVAKMVLNGIRNLIMKNHFDNDGKNNEYVFYLACTMIYLKRN